MLVVALVVVAVAAFRLVTLGVVAAVRPALANRFSQARASTARLHFFELALRLLVGSAVVRTAPQMRGADLARIGGWILVVTTTVLAAAPSREHNRFSPHGRSRSSLARCRWSHSAPSPVG